MCAVVDHQIRETASSTRSVTNSDHQITITASSTRSVTSPRSPDHCIQHPVCDKLTCMIARALAGQVVHTFVNVGQPKVIVKSHRLRLVLRAHCPQVVRTALVDAASVSSLITTSEAVIVESPEEKKGPAMPAAPDMY